MKKIIILIIFLFIINFVSATTFKEYSILKKEYYDYEGLSENKIKIADINLISLARNLRKNSIEMTISNIQHYVEQNIKYEFFWYPRPLNVILREQKGDCSDKAELMLNLLNLNEIPSRRMKGYKDGIRHDYIEVLYPSEDWVYWKPIEKGIKKYGMNFW